MIYCPAAAFDLPTQSVIYVYSLILAVQYALKVAQKCLKEFPVILPSISQRSIISKCPTKMFQYTVTVLLESIVICGKNLYSSDGTYIQYIFVRSYMCMLFPHVYLCYIISSDTN